MSRAKVIVQLAPTVDYGMPFLKDCFNCGGDAHRLSFIVAAEIIFWQQSFVRIYLKSRE